MADPKSNVQQAITNLEKLLRILERDIQRYQDVEFEAKTLGDDESIDIQKKAQASLIKQVNNIDKLIIENPQIKDLIGSLDEDADVKKLNDTILAIVSKVSAVRSLDMKDDKGDDVSFEVKTESVVTEIEKYKERKYTDDKSPDKIEDIEAKIEALKKELPKISEDDYEKYMEVKNDVATKTGRKSEEISIDDVYDEMGKVVADLKGKLKTYKDAIPNKPIDIEKLKKINARTTLKTLSADFKTMFDMLKKVDGEGIKIKIGKDEVAIKGLRYEDFINPKTMNMVEMSDAIKVLCDKYEEEQEKQAGKIEKIQETLSDSALMGMFPADKEKIDNLLKASPIDVKAIEKAIDGLLDPRKFVEFENYDSSKVARVKSEMSKLEGLRTKIQEEQAAEAGVTAATKTDDEIKSAIDAKIAEDGAYGIELEEFTTIKILGRDIEIKRPEGFDESKRFVDLEDKDEIKAILTETYKKNRIDVKKIKELYEEENDAKLPTETFLHRWGAKIRGFFGGDPLTKREKAINKGVKDEIEKAFLGAQEGAQKDRNSQIKGRVTGEIEKAQEQAQEKLESATNARTNAFELDEETRKKVNAAAYEAARKAAIAKAGDKTVDVEKAFNEGGAKAEQEEGRE